MRYTTWLLSIILLCPFSLISMKKGPNSLTTIEPRKKRKIEINISNKNQENNFVKEEPLKNYSLIFIHYLGNIHCINNEYDKNKKRICTNSCVIPNNSHQIVIKTNRKTINNKVALMLPTAPENIIFTIPSDQVHYGDTINFNNDNKKELIIKNITTNLPLLTLPTQKSFICIGNKKKGNQSSKKIIIYNVNLPFVIINNIAYQEPLYYKPKLPIENSKLLFSSLCSIREKEAVTIKTYSTSDNDKINNAFLILETAKALQKIKMYPIDENFPTKLFICFDPETKSIVMHNDTEEILTKIHTNQNYQEIK